MKDYQLTSDGLYAYRWPRASVTADAVLFAEKDGQMHVLLIQRGNEPYKGYWAFPGGFLEMDETVAHCAERELEEETGIVLTGMQLVGIYSDVERDPRGRVVTAAYTAMTTMPEAVASDDAAAAQWWPLNAMPELAFDHDKILADAMKVMGIVAVTKEQLLQMPIERTDFNPRLILRLKEAGINTVGDLAKLTDEEIAQIPQIGKKAVLFIQEWLRDVELKSNK